MFRGPATQLKATSVLPLLVLILGYTTTPVQADILHDIPQNNPLGIDYDPAPSPEEGPPLSAGALRDPAYLPAQIGGIVGAYVLCLVIVGLVLSLLGRRLRMSAQRAARALDIEMLESKMPSRIDTNPRSPVGYPLSPRNFSRPSPEKDGRNPYVFPRLGLSPTTPPGTDPYVDTRIVEADQEMMQRDLEDLYAHVMEQEEAKRAGIEVKEMPPPPMLQRSPQRSPQPQMMAHRPAPPAPVPSGSPQRQGSPTKKIEKTRPSNLNLDEPKSKSHSRTSSIISSLKSPKRKGIRGMRISSPIPTPKSGMFPGGHASDEEPLTPRYYAPPPPPPVPTDQAPYAHSRGPSGDSPTRSIASQLTNYGASANHRANLSQVSMGSMHIEDPNSATSATSQTPLFQSIPPPSQFASQNPYGQPGSAQSSTRALPFRQFETALVSPSSLHPSTKTTVLERTETGNGPRTAGLKTPWSAGAVPYSPYQPFSPMIPITPRLVTKEERKARKRLEPKTPVLEMIKGEDELWDTAY